MECLGINGQLCCWHFWREGMRGKGCVCSGEGMHHRRMFGGKRCVPKHTPMMRAPKHTIVSCISKIVSCNRHDTIVSCIHCISRCVCRCDCIPMRVPIRLYHAYDCIMHTCIPMRVPMRAEAYSHAPLRVGEFRGSGFRVSGLGFRV